MQIGPLEIICYFVFKTNIDKKWFIITPLPVEMMLYIYQINWTNKPINSWLLVQNQVNSLSESESEPEIVYLVHWYICREATLIANTCIFLQRHCRSRCIEIFQWHLIHVHKLPRDSFTTFCLGFSCVFSEISCTGKPIPHFPNSDEELTFHKVVLLVQFIPQMHCMYRIHKCPSIYVMEK